VTLGKGGEEKEIHFAGKKTKRGEAGDNSKMGQAANKGKRENTYLFQSYKGGRRKSLKEGRGLGPNAARGKGTFTKKNSGIVC